MASHIEYTLFPEGMIYPGHPNAIALMIMEAFPSYAAATTREEGRGACAALVSSDVNGSGGSVYSALNVLEILVREGSDAAFEAGNALWLSGCGPGSGNFEENYEKGQTQVDGVKALFLQKATTWDHPTQTEFTAAKLTQDTVSTPDTPSLPRPRI